MNKEELEKLNDLTKYILVFAEDEAKKKDMCYDHARLDNITDDLLKFRKSVLKIQEI